MTPTLISTEEYLASVYKPDVDYVDGNLEVRHLGERNHGELIGRMWLLLKQIPGVFPFLETRLQVAKTRYRVPDVCAYLDRKPDEQIFTRPPFLCLEVLSPEDRLSRMMNVVRDYHAMGVEHIWILDPLDKKAYIASDRGIRDVEGAELIAGKIQASPSVIFSEE